MVVAVASCVVPAGAVAAEPVSVDAPVDGDDSAGTDRVALLVAALGTTAVEEAAEKVRASAARRPLTFDASRPSATFVPRISPSARLSPSPAPGVVSAPSVSAPSDFEYAPSSPVLEAYEQIDSTPTLAEMMPVSRQDLLRARNRASKWACPLRGYTYASSWGEPRSDGRFHEGTDVITPVGAPLRAVSDGVVVRMSRGDSPDSLGGITVSIALSGSESVYYAHLARIAPEVSVGARVVRDQIIGVVGQTGNARFSVPHLHFGWYLGGVAHDAAELLKASCARSVKENLAP